MIQSKNADHIITQGSWVMSNLSRNCANAEVKKKAMPAPCKNWSIYRRFTIHHSSAYTFRIFNQNLREFIKMLVWFRFGDFEVLLESDQVFAFHRFTQRYGTVREVSVFAEKIYLQLVPLIQIFNKSISEQFVF